MKRITIHDVEWDRIFDMADAKLKEYSIPHKVSRCQKEIYLNRPICFVILPYAWDETVLDELRTVPGVMEMQSVNTNKGRYRRFAVYT